MGAADNYRRARALVAVIHLGSQGTCKHRVGRALLTALGAPLSSNCISCYVDELVAMQEAVTLSVSALPAQDFALYERRLQELSDCEAGLDLQAKETMSALLKAVGLRPRV